MPAADDAPDGFVYDAAAQLRHDLKSPLTTIHARAQLLGRYARDSPALAAGERANMPDGVAAIERAVRDMVTAIVALGGTGNAGRTDSSGTGHLGETFKGPATNSVRVRCKAASCDCRFLCA